MSGISSLTPSLLASPNVPPALRSVNAQADDGQAISSSAGNDRLHAAFTQFVGETFYGQMIKAMRSTVGKPAYFHGGRAEEVFRGQLDQALAEHMTDASADKFVEPMFHHQFPNLDDTATNNGSSSTTSGLNELDQLARR